MKLGFFTMPIHPLEKDWRLSLKEDREAFLLADELGFTEAYVGEHVQLNDSLGGLAPALPALAAAAVWLTGAWVAALASREHRWPVVAATVSVAVLLGLLLAVLHGFGRHTLVAGVLVGVFILVLDGRRGSAHRAHGMRVAVRARRRWRRARRAHEAAARTERDDAEMAAITTEAWLGMVRIWANSLGEDQRLVRETVTLAIALLEDSRPQLQSLAARQGLLATPPHRIVGVAASSGESGRQSLTRTTPGSTSRVPSNNPVTRSRGRAT